MERFERGLELASNDHSIFEPCTTPRSHATFRSFEMQETCLQDRDMWYFSHLKTLSTRLESRFKRKPKRDYSRSGKNSLSSTRLLFSGVAFESISPTPETVPPDNPPTLHPTKSPKRAGATGPLPWTTSSHRSRPRNFEGFSALDFRAGAGSTWCARVCRISVLFIVGLNRSS